ncbi:MAG: hypothetical protein HW380_1202 [Magnetococcales bacterium]|nr:hypothetical protein [Magnetococcales bacterium]HIJ85808.1 hypothetical protein [Magnetococcales bacterium]
MAEHPQNAFEQLDGLGPESSHSERMRRMKRLLSQLHRQEVENKGLGISVIKIKGLVLFLSFASIIVFGVTTLYNFNIFITLEEKIISAKGHVEDTMQRRANLFTNLINLTLNQAALEQEVFRHVADVRATMTGQEQAGDKAVAPVGAQVSREGGGEASASGVGGAGLAEAMVGMEGVASLSRLMAVVEQYPEIKSSTTYQKLMDKLVEIEDRIISRRDAYNEDVRVFNTLITSFPWYVLANITGFKRHDYFAIESLSDVDRLMLPNLSSSLFQRLLPLAAGGQKTEAGTEKVSGTVGGTAFDKGVVP